MTMSVTLDRLAERRNTGSNSLRSAAVFGFSVPPTTTDLFRGAGKKPAQPSAPPAEATMPCPAGVPWCEGDPDWHDDERAVHDSAFVVLPVHTDPCRRHDEGPAGDEIWLALEREDEGGQPGATHIYLAPVSSDPTCPRADESHLDFDQAETLADRLLELVARGRGSKRARDIVVGDTVVFDGVAQMVVITLQDGECCCCGDCPGPDACPGSYAFTTTECVTRDDWATSGGRWSFAPDALIPVAGVA